MNLCGYVSENKYKCTAFKWKCIKCFQTKGYHVVSYFLDVREKMKHNR